MNCIKKLLSFSFITLFAASVSAITLDECRDFALDNYPLLKQQGLIEKSEQYTINVIKTAWMPQVMLSAQATYQSNVPSYASPLVDVIKAQGIDVQGMQKGQYRLQADVRQMIYDGGETSHIRKNTFLASNEQKATLEVELNKVEQRVDELYFSILLMKKQLESISLKENLLSTNLEQMNNMMKNGAAAQSDCDVLNAEILGVKQQKLNIEANINSFKQMLSLFIGKEVGDEFVLPEPKNEEGEDLRLKLLQIDAKEALLQNKEQGIKIACRPQVYLFGQLFCGYPGLDYMDAMVNRDFNFDALLGIRASWNISSFYSISDKRSGIQARRDILNLHRETLQFNANINKSRIKNDVERLKALQTDDQKIVELRENIRKASEKRLSEGKANTIELVQRINEEVEARIGADLHTIETVRSLYRMDNALVNRS